MEDSYISSGEAGITFAGPDAVKLYQASMLRSALGLLAKGIKPSRAWTVSKALAAAEAFTGKHYKRTQIELARADLKTWADAMSMALPRKEG